VDASGQIRKRVRRLPRAQWAVLIQDHHPGFIDWATYEANQERLAANTHPLPHAASGAVREGAALLQGLAVCGHCGRRLHTHYRGRHAAPGYHCAGKTVVNGRGLYCLSVGGVQIDAAVTRAFLEALTPAALQAVLRAAEQLESDRDAALGQWRLALERARYAAQCAERRYRAVDPENRLVARGLEAEWERSLGALAAAEAELARRTALQPRTLSPQERQRLEAVGADLERVWNAPTTTDHDRKGLLRNLLVEVVVAVDRAQACARLTLRWRGGAITPLDVPLPRSHPPALRTDEDTIDLVRRLAAPSTLHRQLNDGLIAGEQVTPGAPWRIVITEALRAHFAGEAPEGFVPIVEAMRRLGVSRQTVLQRVKRGELEAIQEARQVDVHHPFFALRHIPACGRDRIMRRAPRTKAPAVLAHGAVEGRAQHLMQALLNEPVLHRGNAQPADSPAGLGDVHRAHRRRLVVARKELLPNARPVALEVGLGLGDPFAVHPAGPGIGFHRRPGPFHVGGTEHRLQTDVYRVAH
jgi:hypothetical protein